jgi:RecA/RadA recombinase
VATAEEIAKSLAGAIGANDEESTVRSFLSSGYAPFNYALSNKWNGGFGGGRMIEVSGPAASGKTAIYTAAAACAQNQGGIAGFNDHERTFSLVLAPKLGLNTEPGRFVYKKPRTYEDSLSLCVAAGIHIRTKKLIAPEAPIVWGFDSLASMVPQSALIDAKTGEDKTFDNRSMHDNTALARATSASFPAFAQYCEELDICAIFLNQIRTNINVKFGDPRKTSGGSAPEYYFSQRVMLNQAKKITRGEGETAEVLGMEISATVIKNKIARPFRKANWRFVFQPDGTGRFDVERSTVEFLVKEKILERAGAYTIWKGTKFHAETLARLIEKERRMSELLELLPKEYEPPIVAEVPIEEEAA